MYVERDVCGFAVGIAKAISSRAAVAGANLFRVLGGWQLGVWEVYDVMFGCLDETRSACGVRGVANLSTIREGCKLWITHAGRGVIEGAIGHSHGREYNLFLSFLFNKCLTLLHFLDYCKVFGWGSIYNETQNVTYILSRFSDTAKIIWMPIDG